MFRTIHLKNLGPHADTTLHLSPDGLVEIEGGSKAGKSTLIDAVCYALWGVNRDGDPLPTEQISGDRATVELTVGRTGTVLTRTITPRRSETWAITARGITEELTSNAAMMAKLSRIGACRELGRIIVSPLAWIDLLKTDLGRPLRDLLLSTLDTGASMADVVRAGMERAGVEMLPTDPLVLADALVLQTAGNSARDTASGVLNARSQAVRQAKAALVSAPTDAAQEHARAVLASRDAWASYRGSDQARADLRATIAEQERVLAEVAPAAIDTTEARAVLALTRAWDIYDRQIEQWRATEQRRADIRQRRERLGARPVYDAAALQQKIDSLPRIRDALVGMGAKRDALTAAVAVARRAHLDLSSAGDGCPTCKQAWSQKASAREDAAISLTKAETAAKNQTDTYDRNAARVAELEAEVQALQTAAAAQRAWDQANREIGAEPAASSEPTPPTQARPGSETVNEANAHIAAASDVDADIRALGNRQTVARTRLRTATDKLAALGTTTAPAGEAPTDAEVTAATQTIQAATQARAADTTYRAALTAEQAAQDALTQATAEAARREVLVRVLREAPTTVARAQQQLLGDTGPVSFEFPERVNKQTPAIKVLIGGRPWRLASGGELLVADLWVRATLRRLAKLPMLPIIVDQPQNWSGSWPTFPGSVWYLTTTDGEIRVNSADSGARAAA